MARNDPISVAGLMDAAPLAGLPLWVASLSFLIMILDGFDLQAMAFAAPALAVDWSIKRELLGPVLIASIIGMGPGSVALGWLADRIGRKAAFCICITLLSLGSLLCISAANLTQLFIYRVVCGLGLGGAAPLAAALIAEWMPARWRGAGVAVVIVAIPLGGMLGAALAQHLIPAHGWRAVFVVGGVFPLLLAALAAVQLPESPKFLARDPARRARLAAVLNRLVGEPRFSADDHFLAEPQSPSAGSELLQLLRSPYLATTLLLWAAFSCNTLALYGFVNWLPTVLSGPGAATGSGLSGSFAFNAGGIVGAIGGALLIGRLGSRAVGTSVALLGALVTAAIGLAVVGSDRTPSVGAEVLLLVMLAGACLHGMQAYLYAVGAHSYPTAIRGSGVGCASAVARVGGVLSSGVGSALFAFGLSLSVFFFTLAVVIGVTAASFFALRSHIPPRPALSATVGVVAPRR
jgi:AAHS family 4-hydroxybenzoate transporter-like MFS transporter